MNLMIVFIVMVLGSVVVNQLGFATTHFNNNNLIQADMRAENIMPTSQEVLDQFIKVFPELKPSDFPPVGSEDSAYWWLIKWQSDYEISTKYIASSEYKDWWWHIDKSLNDLSTTEDKKLNIKPTLDKMYAYIEQFEDEENSGAENDLLTYEDLFGDDDSLTIEEIYSMYYENVVSEILKHNFDVIGVDNGESANFILAERNNPELDKLAELLSEVWGDSYVSLYRAKDYPEKYKFKFSIENLDKQ